MTGIIPESRLDSPSQVLYLAYTEDYARALALRAYEISRERKNHLVREDDIRVAREELASGANTRPVSRAGKFVTFLLALVGGGLTEIGLGDVLDDRRRSFTLVFGVVLASIAAWRQITMGGDPID